MNHTTYNIKYIASRIINWYWYDWCNVDNITTDEIYKWFFNSILEKERWISEEKDAIIDMFIYEIKNWV